MPTKSAIAPDADTPAQMSFSAAAAKLPIRSFIDEGPEETASRNTVFLNLPILLTPESSSYDRGAWFKSGTKLKSSPY